MEKFVSHPLRPILTLLCLYAFVTLPQRDAFTPSRLCHAVKRCISYDDTFVSELVRSTSAATLRRGCPGFKSYLDRHGRQFMSVSPGNEENTNDTDSVTSSSTIPKPSSSYSDLSPTELIMATEKMDPATRAVVEAAQKKRQLEEEEVRKYPIDLPSPILLSASMILAIASAGCLFELLGGNSESMVFSFGPTLAVALLGTPLSIFLLYAAITKATAETEEDDQAFLSGK